MDFGEIVESGKHEDLLKLDGAYKTLMERQMNNQGGTFPSKNKRQPTRELQKQIKSFLLLQLKLSKHKMI